MSTLKQLKCGITKLRYYAVPAFKVRDEAHARKLNAADPLGRTWRVGDAYYKVPRRA